MPYRDQPDYDLIEWLARTPRRIRRDVEHAGNIISRLISLLKRLRNATK